MIDINSIGEVGHGRGGGHASINNTPFSKGAFGGFVDPDTWAFVNGDDDWKVWLHLRQGVKHRLTWGAYGLDGVGANDLYAGGGVIASQLKGGGPDRGIYASTGFRSVEGGLVGVGPQGQIIYKPDYQSNGPTVVREIDGHEWTLTNGAPLGNSFVSLLDRGVALWQESPTAIHSLGFTPQLVPGQVWGLQAAVVDGVIWLVYFHERLGVIAHPSNSFSGIQVVRPGTDAWHRVRGNGTQLLIAVSAGEGEQPGQIYGYRFDLKSYTKFNLLTGEPLGSFVLTDLAPVKPDPGGDGGGVKSMRVPAFPRKMWMAPYYSHHRRYGDTPLDVHAGNAIWVGGDESDIGVIHTELARISLLGMPMIVALDAGLLNLDTRYTDLTIAISVHASNLGHLEAEVARAKSSMPIKPIIAYMDKMELSAWPEHRPSWMDSDRIWPSFPAYRNPGETTAAFRARIEAILDRVAGYGLSMTLTPGFYTRSGQLDPEEVLACMKLYDNWIRRYPMAAIMPFADRRPSGMLEHPEFREWAMAFKDAIPAGRPNRNDHWTPPGGPIESLRNKLMQDLEIHMLSAAERRFLLQKMDAAANPIPAPMPTPDPGHGGEEEKPMAPNISHVVKDIVRAHPEIDLTDETSPVGRARVLDLTIAAVGGRPWGRKARNADGSNKNTDALCYLRPDGRHEIYDALNGSNPSGIPDNWVSWVFHDIHAPGANGYWAPGEPV